MSVPEVTIDQIKQLIAKAEPNDGFMHCTFKCPKTGISVNAGGYLQHAKTPPSTDVNSTKRNLGSSIKDVFHRLIGRDIAHSGGDSVTPAVTSQPSGLAQNATEWSAAEMNAGVVRAFNSVKEKFHWDDDTNTWVAKYNLVY